MLQDAVIVTAGYCAINHLAANKKLFQFARDLPMAFAFFKCAPCRRGIPTQSVIRAVVGVERGPLPSGMCGAPGPLSTCHSALPPPVR